jgi:hypothetical protein
MKKIKNNDFQVFLYFLKFESQGLTTSYLRYYKTELIESNPD